MKRLFSIMILGLFFASLLNVKADDNIQGSSGGEYSKVSMAGAQFLKIGPGARANAMGGAYGSVADDATALFWNPAGIAKLEGVNADFSYTSWFGGFSHNYAAATAQITEDFFFGASFINFTSGQIPITTINDPDGTGSEYSVNDMSFGVTFGGYLTEEFSFGITSKFINNSFSSMNSNGFAFDIGTMYQTGLNGINLGFSIHNLGTTMQYGGEGLKDSKKIYDAMNAMPLEVAYSSSAYDLPLIFRAGVSADIYKSEEHYIMAAGDFLTSSDVSEQFALGTEYVWHNILAVRAGYIFGHSTFGFSGGIGIQYQASGLDGEVNYSISPMEDLTWVNRISISVKMD